MTDSLHDAGIPRTEPADSRQKADAPTLDGPMNPAYGSASEELHLVHYLRVIYKRRWAAATAFGIMFFSVVLYTFTRTPIYAGKAQLLIEPENPNIVSFKEVIDENQAGNDYFQTQHRLLSSRALARRTIESLNLWRHTELRAQTDRQGLDAVNKMLEWWSPQAVPWTGESAAQSHVIDAFIQRLSVSPIRNSRLVDVTFRAADPALAAAVVNRLATTYVEQSLEYKFLASKDASDWLSVRLAEQRKQVEAAEMALHQYRERNDAISLEERENIVVQKLADLNAAVTRAKTERIEKEAVYSQLRAMQGKGARDSFPAILSNAYIQQLKGELAQLQRQQAQLSERLGERHPEITKLRSSIESTESRLQGEVGKVVQSVRSEFLSAEAQERSLASALETQKADALAMNRKGIEYSVLEREAVSNRQIYESLLQRAKETGISTELRNSNIRIIDEAEVPRSAAWPRRGLNIVLGFLGASIFSLTLALLFDYLDDTVRVPEHIRMHLGVPFLGYLPVWASDNGSSNYPLVSRSAPAHFAEAVRTLRTNMLFTSADEGSRSLLVTSTGPNDGKTVVAANVAVSLAQAGARVLLVDGDLRKPKVHEVFSLNAEPGLSNLLVGTAKANEAVKKSAIAGLWLLTAGRLPPNPVELLSSQRFKEFLLSLKEHFDWVVIDSPPILAVADSTVLGHAVTDVLFVVASERTSRRTARAALEQLRAAKARISGAVLNRVETERHGYYYADFYRREYSRYYGQTEKA